VQVLNNLGSAYYFPGSYSEAMHRYDDAMILVEQHGSAKWSDYWRQITSFNQVKAGTSSAVFIVNTTVVTLKKIVTISASYQGVTKSAKVTFVP
jgi:hypothetical protein